MPVEAPKAGQTLPVPQSIVACGPNIPLPVGVAVLSSTLVGDDVTQGSCLRGAAPECVFMLDVPTRSEVRLSLESADFDGALVLMSDERKEELACIDDTPSGDTRHARIETTLLPGRYAVVVESGDSEAGQFSLFAELDPLPSIPEGCAHARGLTKGVTLRGSTRGAANQFEASCAGGAQGPDRVHSFELGVRSRVRLSQQAEHEGALYLRSRCEDAESEVQCVDGVHEGRPQWLTAELEAGRYYVFADSYGRGQSGDYVLSLEHTQVPAAYDVEAVCAAASARVLTEGEHEFDTFYAPSVLEGSCGGSATPESLFHLRLPQETTVQLELLDPEFDAVLYLRVACDDDRSELACVRLPRQDPEESAPRVFSATLGPGEYTLGIDGQASDDMGAARLRFTTAPLSMPSGLRLPAER